MGRQAGLTAEDAQRRLFDAAVEVFAERGYDGTRISDVAAAAGLTSGAIYNHFESKAGLLQAVIDQHSLGVLSELLSADAGESTVDTFRLVANALPAKARPVLLEALVAARRDSTVHATLGARFRAAERALSDLAGAAQDSGDLDAGVAPAALGRFVLMFVMGAVALSVLELDEVDPDDWANLVERLIGGVAP